MAVEIRNLRVVRGSNLVLDGLDLEITRGSITGVLGPSGCGKTTLMRAIVGAQKTAGGEVRIFGEPAGDPSLRTRIAYDTQQASVYADLTVRQNIEYFAQIVGAPKTDIDRVIHSVGLVPQAQQVVGTLSEGQQNRVSLAVALLGSPELIVLDEPTVGLDPILRTKLWDLFRAIADQGVTLLISSHVMDEALRCDQLILMREGKIVANTTPQALLTETNTKTPDEAFLKLITEQSEPEND